MIDVGAAPLIAGAVLAPAAARRVRRAALFATVMAYGCGIALWLGGKGRKPE